MGVTEISHMLMILAVSQKMTESERHIVTEQMIRGFNDTCEEAGTKITGGQTVKNPSPIIGGVANALCHPEDIIMPRGAQAGDVLVLTKPLGTQVAVNLEEWAREDNDTWNRTTKKTSIKSKTQIENTVRVSNQSMGTLNRNAASIMKKYGARAATDITGFGLMGHGKNLAEA